MRLFTSKQFCCCMCFITHVGQNIGESNPFPDDLISFRGYCLKFGSSLHSLCTCTVAKIFRYLTYSLTIPVWCRELRYTYGISKLSGLGDSILGCSSTIGPHFGFQDLWPVQDFFAVDPHLGTKETLKDLSAKLHERRLWRFSKMSAFFCGSGRSGQLLIGGWGR